jgi:hypothetical protein
VKRHFNIGVNWKPSKDTIKESSSHFWKILKALSEVDIIFVNPIFMAENQKDVGFQIDKLSEENAVDLIALTILNFSKYDIRKYEKEQNPTIEYSRDFGFSFVLMYKHGNSKISFSVKVGNPKACGMTLLSYGGDKLNLKLCYSTLKALVSGSNAIKGSISLLDLPFQEGNKNIIAPLGWITYFSNDFKPVIPDDLEGIEYEYTDKGKYLILTRDDFPTDKKIFEGYKQKLLNIMEEIKRRVPEYSK